MAKVKITQVVSAIKKTDNQKRVLASLGLGKINSSVEQELTPSIKGMLNKVNHLVVVSE
ncbi:50S ribosomal protein L30 [Cytophaga hutchinsonii]|jgi:large subunit ribosomal protein L30|uniref:Large ribosomal subunit protein uL30 n=1 Tax=Cytophaga hutchinsonii (strain ATCC 33406 / DSM 1761 / CIP 103989 / NBRC 15051 / NCIMB 9469 / D465) TaxID=269798 RepID=RL30_CYTH3|nr:50S ribosomal protein L30 [Cytophaga hutchinsonii]Q11QD0.1 RecName: Full=Large ribosomal subunit protein uL30; AltName: Full=50S ribosomal protein L30 [Cytophaga hutchinsonii ATCC 33406]ABG60384.1 LSU ribosomal protein L30P [Cytophaga hutchinsonii ATCC 33406]SFX87083.1 LSU ribosomal protein L30P [Cytophaga hutchinsonii ATCC 33406]